MDNTLTDTPNHILDSSNDAPSQILGLDHVAVAVLDLDQAVEWYCSALGFRLIEKRLTRGQSTSMMSAVMKAGPAIVVLVQGLEPDSQVRRFIDAYGPGVQHVAFAVGDLDKALEGVRQAGGLAETGVLEGDGIRQAFLRRDPGAAVRVELIERNGGAFSDDSVEGLFRQMEQRGLY